MIGTGWPSVAADLARSRERMPTPQDLSGLAVERRQPAAHSKFPARVAAVDDAVVVKRRAGYPVAVVPVLNRRLPHLFAGLDVERDDIGVQLAEEQRPLAHRQAPVEPTAAYGRDLLVDARPPLPLDFAGLRVKRENVVVAGYHVHDPVFDERRRLRRVLASKPGAFETGHPGTLELLDGGRVDLLQRGVAIIGQVAAVGDPILGDRTLKQVVNLGVRSPDGA